MVHATIGRDAAVKVVRTQRSRWYERSDQGGTKHQYWISTVQWINTPALQGVTIMTHVGSTTGMECYDRKHIQAAGKHAPRSSRQASALNRLITTVVPTSPWLVETDRFRDLGAGWSLAAPAALSLAASKFTSAYATTPDPPANEMTKARVRPRKVGFRWERCNATQL